MTKLTLKDKQIAAGKFKAEQYALLKDNGAPARKGEAVVKNKGGRPKTGRKQVAVWMEDSFAIVLSAFAAQTGVTQGVMVEMMLSLCAPAELLYVAGKNK